MWSVFSWLTSRLISNPLAPGAGHRDLFLLLPLHRKNSSILDLCGWVPHFTERVSSPSSREPPQPHPPFPAFLFNSISSSKHLQLIDSIHLFGYVCRQALPLTEPQGAMGLSILFPQRLKRHGRSFMNICSMTSEWTNKWTNTEIVSRITQSL